MCFRQVKEIWGKHSSCFVAHDTLLRVLHEIATQSGSSSEDHPYGDKRSVWIEDGNKFLDFIGNERAFTAERIARMLKIHRTQLNDLRFLVSNMQLLAGEWRSSIDAHGALTFYVDAY
jgi:hypothetical protein